MSRSKYSASEKFDILMEYYNGDLSKNDILKKYSIYKKSLEDWEYKFNNSGIVGLEEAHSNMQYSKEFKEQVVEEYLTGQYSILELTKKYNISSHSVLYQWIKKYNSHIELKNTGKGMSAIMTKGRNTTWKERIEIVDFCIANKLDYQKTSVKYRVSYQQVYTWVKKYEDGGVDALKDKRGRKKAKEELTPEEQMILKFKKLEAENQRLKAENLLLKKLDELERRRS